MPPDLDTALTACEQIEEYLLDERLPDERFCSICLLQFLAHLEANPPILTLLKTRRHGLWETCMRNLSAPLTESEQATMRERLAFHMDLCHFGKDSQAHRDELQHRKLTHVADPIDLRNTLLCHLLRLCLHAVDETTRRPQRSVVDRARYQQKRFRAANGAWPPSIDQLFPYGELRTVQCIVDFCCTLASEHAFWVLSAIVELGRPLIWHCLLEPETHNRICWAISTTILLSIPSAAEQHASNPSHAPGCKIPPSWKNAEWLHDGKTAFQAVTTLLDIICSGAFSRPDDKLAFLQPHADMLAPAFRAALDHYGSTRPEPCKKIRVYLDVLANAAAPLVPGLDEDAAALVARAPRGNGVLCIVRIAISTLRCNRRCTAHTCGRTMLERLDGEDRALPLCARCRFAAYCSQACQRADWTGGQPVPHRLLCPVLVKLRDTADIYIAETEYIRIVRDSDISDAELALAGDGRFLEVRACIMSFVNHSRARYFVIARI